MVTGAGAELVAGACDAVAVAVIENETRRKSIRDVVVPRMFDQDNDNWIHTASHVWLVKEHYCGYEITPSPGQSYPNLEMGL
jgi:hypothetical protein